MVNYSLTIGVNQYSDARISPLKFAEADAREIHNFFVRGLENVRPNIEDRSVIKRENQIILLNENATMHNILTSIVNIAEKCNPEDSVIFYFAGHGNSTRYKKNSKHQFDERFVDDGYIKYIIPYNADVDSLITTAIDFQTLATNLNRIKSSQMIMIFDCCYSGAADGRTFNANPDQRNSVPSDINTSYTELLTESGTGRIVMTACTGTEIAYEKSNYGHGVFTKFILEGLKGEADVHKTGIRYSGFWICQKTVGESVLSLLPSTIRHSPSTILDIAIPRRARKHR